MARLAVTKLAAHLRGEKVEPRIATGETLATPENMDEPADQAAARTETLRRIGGQAMSADAKLTAAAIAIACIGCCACGRARCALKATRRRRRRGR